MDPGENSDASTSNSQEDIKKVKARLLEEGREARNLVAYSVSIQQNKSPSNPAESGTKTVTPVRESRKPLIKQEKRLRSVSAGRNPQANLRARHWGFLFRNLEQAVDEIYQTCEDDESVIECKEAILMLERYTKDFHKLIEWLKLKWEFEKVPPPQRPTSVSWEIRTASPRCLVTRRKNFLLLDANLPSEGPSGTPSAADVSHNSDIDQSIKSIISQECDNVSPPRKLSTVDENEIIEKIVERDEKPQDLNFSPQPQQSIPINGVIGKNNTQTVGTLKTTKTAGTLEPKLKTDVNLEKPPVDKKLDQSEPKKLSQSERFLCKANCSTSMNTSKDPSSKILGNRSQKRLVTAPLNSSRDEEKVSNSTLVRSKSTTSMKSQTNSKNESDSSKAEQMVNAEQIGPTVNMNKASQVRQAYNQNRAPLKSNKPVTWKNAHTNHGTETTLGSGRPEKSFSHSPKWPTNQSSNTATNRSSQRKNWINYTSNMESAPIPRTLVRSVTSLAKSQIIRKTESLKTNNDCSRSTSSLATTTANGQSWADKVKGCRTNSENAQISRFDEDTEGWEIVRRGRRGEGSMSLNSPSKKSTSSNSKTNALSFKMQKRFDQPTSAVSLPSLIDETSSSPNNSVQSRDAKCEKGSSAKIEKEAKEEMTGSLNKSEKNICNHLRKQESDIDAKTVKGSKVNNAANTIMSTVKTKSRRMPKECISISENTSDSEREEEEMSKNEALFATAIKEEQRLKKQIEETENNSIEAFVEEGIKSPSIDISFVQEDETIRNEASDSLSDSPERSFPPFPTVSWADMGPLENLRQPGRVLHIHEKLSSPARRLTSSEKLKKHQEKLAKAEELRGKLIHDKTEKLKDLFRRIEEVNIDKDRLLLEKRHLFEKKMTRAQEKRKRHLQQIVNKAHDEENKAREIAFINDLEAQNKLHDIMQQQQCHESRLAEMAEERSRKLEEKAAKEAAAQERRKAIEAERQARMDALCEKRRRRCERIARLQAERREDLLEQAREKARDREERLSALQQAQQTKESELVKKIQQKQEETARRHEENIELIRQRALESSITRCSRGCDDAPKLLRYETKKLCSLCNSLIASEVCLLSHLRSRRHQDALKDLYKDEVTYEQTAKYNLKHIIDAPKNMDDPEVTRDQERQKSLKKKCRKIKIRMVNRGNQFLKDYKHPSTGESKFKSRMAKALQQIGKLVSSQGSGPWPACDVSALDKYLLELHRLLDKGDRVEATTFLGLEGFAKLNDVLNLITNNDDSLACILPPKPLSYAVRVLHAACLKYVANCEYVFQSNFIVDAIDQLSKRMAELADDIMKPAINGAAAQLASDPVCTGLMEFIGYVLEVVLKAELDQKDRNTEAMEARIKEVVSYSVSVGVVDKLTWYFNRVQGPVDNDQPSTDFLLASMKILSSLTHSLTRVRSFNDPTQLINTIQATDSYGVSSLLYGLLLQEAGRSASPPSDYFSPSTLAITYAGTTLLCNLAKLDLKLFQSILGSEGISLELRHICSFLLWYCSHWPTEEVLHNVIVLVGFFTVDNKENQSIMQSGETPSVLQQLCNLPWNYFTDTRLTSVLFPTLLACCLDNEDNLRIIEQDMTFQILEEFLLKKEAPEKPLVKILHKMQNIQ